VDSISLSSLAINVNDKRNLHHILPLEAFDGSNDLLDVIYEYLEDMKRAPAKDENLKKFSRVERVDLANRQIRGIFESGEYGRRIKFRDVESNKTSYTSKASEAGMLPFYFLFHLPAKQNKGIVLLQRFKQFGVQEVLLDRFHRYFGNRFSDYTLNITTLTNTNVINEYVRNARLTQIKFIQHQWPSDLADEVQSLRPKEKPGYIETIVHAAFGTSLPYKDRLMKFIKGDLPLDKVVEANIPHNEIKFIMNVGGKQRTLDLGSTSDFRSNFDVTSDVTLDEGGHPEFNSIDAEALDILDALSNDLYKGKVR
jgi:hypothetical protein